MRCFSAFYSTNLVNLSLQIFCLQIDTVNITPEDNYDPDFNTDKLTLNDVSHVLPDGLDIGLIYTDLVLNLTDLDYALTPALSTGRGGGIFYLDLTLRNSVELLSLYSYGCELFRKLTLRVPHATFTHNI